ncbi:MaoC family dehydratase [Rhodococcus globerulus]|uniref:MaoC family dehydratase n=1 Tax=Rhodococcus globerulus TaxID=33008 RepID=UPI0030198416
MTDRDRLFANILVGDELPDLRIPITRSLIVAGAIASRDYQDVHHDPELARERGSRDIFMNILTSNGLVERYVRSWAGPGAVLKQLKIQLGAPNYPGDEMRLHGVVTEADIANGQIALSVAGDNSLGIHLSGSAVLQLPTPFVA